MHTVAVAIFDGTPVFETGVACEVFGIDRSAMGVPNYRLRVCAIDPSPVRTGGGFSILTDHGIAQVRRADTIVVPGWKDFDRPVPAEFLRALRSAHARGARIISFCSGSFVLAAAGLLDERRATTHWMHVDALATRFPQVRWDPSVLYIDDGSGIFTAAGTAAGIDLCLHLVRQDHGTEVANVVARRMVVPPHRDGGQAQFVEAPLPSVPSDVGLSQTLEWATANLDDALTVEALARHARVSPRTFARRFKAAVGETPLQWVLHQRVLAARRLLESTDLGIDLIASRVGFGSAASLRVHFARVVGTSPTAYRSAFSDT